jgi:sterol desaturase/sphingolipid hydroxylase (fatty acid hydroxylase superfamily)
LKNSYPTKKEEDIVALISCPDCGRKVSSEAPSCPDCGRPIKQISPNKLEADQTIELTGKRLKIWMVAAVLLFFIGLIMMISAASAGDGASSVGTFGAGMLFAGIVLFIVTKVRVWWYHK